MGQGISGWLFGSFISDATATHSAIQGCFGIIFLLMVVVSFLLCFKLYNYVIKCKAKQIFKDIVKSLLQIIIISDVLFVIVILMFRNIREGRIVHLPLSILMLCLIFAAVLLYITCKTYMLASTECEYSKK